MKNKKDVNETATRIARIAAETRDHELPARYQHKTGHTPGPWTVDQPQGMLGFEIMGGGGLICQMTPMLSKKAGSEDNARLISAAPELLEALEVAEEASLLDATPEPPQHASHDAKMAWFAIMENADELREKACLLRRAAILKASPRRSAKAEGR